MRGFIVALSLVGFGLLGRGLYGLFGLESTNEVGLETMTAVEIGLGALVLVLAFGFVGVLDLLDPLPKAALQSKEAEDSLPVSTAEAIAGAD